MKRTHKIIAGLLLAAGIGSVAFAQGGPGGWGCDGMGPMGRKANMKFDPAQRVERHLAMLKYQLDITDAQEPLWQAYEQKLKAEAGKGFQAMRGQAADANLSAPERMAKMQSLMEERLAAMKDVHVSFSRLYDGLTPEQKKVADQHAAQMGRFGPGGKGRMMSPPAAHAPQS